MKAEESDMVCRKGKYPDGHTVVEVREKEKNQDSYKWTSGRPTGETDQFGEQFEVVTDSPLVESDKAFYHYEDIRIP